MTDVDHIVSTLPTHLPRTDVHRRHAEIRTLSDGDARIPDDRSGTAQQPEEVLGKHVAEQMKVARVLLLPEYADTLRRAIGSGVHVRPEPEDGNAEILHGIQ